MFGGQDDNAQAPQNGDGNEPKTDTLNGVNDLVGGTGAPASTSDDSLPIPAHPEQTGSDTTAPTPTDNTDDTLLELKQQALRQLTPLVGHLDQSPLDKFRTTMMLIQASDDKSLLTQAYDAAQAIEDEKVRAQALLDVVNEINYFTQNNPQ
jgi:hypothetical protein